MGDARGQPPSDGGALGHHERCVHLVVLALHGDAIADVATNGHEALQAAAAIEHRRDDEVLLDDAAVLFATLDLATPRLAARKGALEVHARALVVDEARDALAEALEQRVARELGVGGVGVFDAAAIVGDLERVGRVLHAASHQRQRALGDLPLAGVAQDHRDGAVVELAGPHVHGHLGAGSGAHHAVAAGARARPQADHRRRQERCQLRTHERVAGCAHERPGDVIGQPHPTRGVDDNDGIDRRAPELCPTVRIVVHTASVALSRSAHRFFSVAANAAKRCSSMATRARAMRSR